MFTDSQIEQMRRELENPSLMQKRIDEEKQANLFIEATKKRFAREGRDFEKEFKEWQKSR